jgi:hypothetical protein
MEEGCPSVLDSLAVTGGKTVDATAEQTMAKAKGRPKQEKRHDASAKIDAGILARARAVATARGITLAEYLSEVLRAPVARDFAREMKKIEEEGDEP